MVLICACSNDFYHACRGFRERSNERLSVVDFYHTHRPASLLKAYVPIQRKVNVGCVPASVTVEVMGPDAG